jgi:hypothetical protein
MLRRIRDLRSLVLRRREKTLVDVIASLEDAAASPPSESLVVV